MFDMKIRGRIVGSDANAQIRSKCHDVGIVMAQIDIPCPIGIDEGIVAAMAEFDIICFSIFQRSTSSPNDRKCLVGRSGSDANSISCRINKKHRGIGKRFNTKIR